MAKPKIIYAARVNLGGLHSKTPLKCSLDNDDNLWWTSDGNFEVSKLGTDCDPKGYHSSITFSSIDKKEVELWIAGANAVMKMLQSWSS